MLNSPRIVLLNLAGGNYLESRRPMVICGSEAVVKKFKVRFEQTGSVQVPGGAVRRGSVEIICGGQFQPTIQPEVKGEKYACVNKRGKVRYIPQTEYSTWREAKTVTLVTVLTVKRPQMWGS